jgi:hypothetical protein
MRRLLLPPALLLSAALLPAADPPAAAPAVAVDNFADGDTVRYSVVFLRGTLADPRAAGLTVVNASAGGAAREVKGLVHKGLYKALAELAPGDNRLVLRAGRAERALTLRYRPQTNPYVVRVVYMTDSGGGTAYQTPLPRDPQDYEAKLDAAFKLLQGFTAEQMNDLGFGRRTFNLELDDKGRLKVHTVKAPRPASYYYGLDVVAWYLEVRRWADEEFPDPRLKKAVIAAYTRYDPRTQKTQGNIGRGGGSTALFGNGSLWAWPSRPADAFAAFTNPAPVDARRILDDSAGRSTVWGLDATTIPVMLHELGHTWDLPHTKDPFDVMAPRGFDHFNRFWTFVEPPSKLNARPSGWPGREATYFAAISGAGLKDSRWFALDDRPWKETGRPRVKALNAAGDLEIEAENGLGYLGVDVRDEAVDHRSFGGDGPPPRRLRLSADELRRMAGTTDVRLRALDAEGLLTQVETAKLPRR